MINFEIRPNKDLVSFAGAVGKGYDKPLTETATALYKMTELMQKSSVFEGAREQAERVHEIIKWDIEQIRSILLPRILSLETGEPELIGVLSELDNADRNWVNQYILDKEVSAGKQYMAAADFFR